MSMPIKVGGKGLIPRGYGIAPRKEPFMADLTLIQTIMAQGGLTVDYVKPGSKRTIRLTSENLKRTYQKHEEEVSKKTGKSVFTRPAPNQELPKEPEQQPDADPNKDKDLTDPSYSCQACGVEFKYADKRTPAEGDPILCPTCEEAAKVKAQEDEKKALEEEANKANAAKLDKVKTILEPHFATKIYQGTDEAVAGLIQEDVAALVTDETMKMTDLNLEEKTVVFEINEELSVEFKFQLEDLPVDPEKKVDENNGTPSGEDGFTLRPKTQENPDNNQGRNQGGNNRNNNRR